MEKQRSDQRVSWFLIAGSTHSRRLYFLFSFTLIVAMIARPSNTLTIESPSPTTVSYSVSNKRHPKSKLVARLRGTARVVLISYAVLIDFAKAQTILDLGHASRYVDLLLKISLTNPLVQIVAGYADWWVLAILTAITLYVCLRRNYTEESLLVLRGLGIQTSTSSPYFFQSPTTTFIPTTQIQDIVIHEAFKGLEVRYYLAVIVEGASEVVVVFPHLLPKREILEQVWRGARKCLYNGNGSQ